MPFWTEREIQVLREMKQQGFYARVIGERVGRSKGCVEAKWRSLHSPKVRPSIDTRWRPTIEDGIPIPEVAFGRIPHRTVIPWAKLNVGQSMFVPEERYCRKALTYLAARRGTDLCYKFSVRKWVENGVLGTRIWRVD